MPLIPFVAPDAPRRAVPAYPGESRIVATARANAAGNLLQRAAR
jgi:hypothetical protein